MSGNSQVTTVCQVCLSQGLQLIVPAQRYPMWQFYPVLTFGVLLRHGFGLNESDIV